MRSGRLSSCRLRSRACKQPSSKNADIAARVAGPHYRWSLDDYEDACPVILSYPDLTFVGVLVVDCSCARQLYCNH